MLHPKVVMQKLQIGVNVGYFGNILNINTCPFPHVGLQLALDLHRIYEVTLLNHTKVRLQSDFFRSVFLREKLENWSLFRCFWVFWVSLLFKVLVFGSGFSEDFLATISWMKIGLISTFSCQNFSCLYWKARKTQILTMNPKDKPTHYPLPFSCCGNFRFFSLRPNMFVSLKSCILAPKSLYLFSFV